MTLRHPEALWALGLSLILLLLSLWRLRPQRQVVPSIRLWERIPDRRPPVRALQRPRWSILLLLQILTLASLVMAWADPATVSEAPAPRRIALVFDTSASMIPRLARAKERARELIAKFTPGDEIAVYAQIPEPMVHRGDPEEGLAKVRCVAREMDVAKVLRSVTEPVVFLFGDEARSGVGVVGSGLRSNSGIADVRPEGEGLFVRLAHVGPERDRTVSVELEGKPVGAPRRIRLSAAGAVLTLPRGDTVRLDPDDFPEDDEVRALRQEPVRLSVQGDADPRLMHALSVSGEVEFGSGGAVRLCLRSRPESDAPFLILVDPPAGIPGVTLGEEFTAREWSVQADHPLMTGVDPARLPPLPARAVGVEGGVPVLWGDGKPVGVVREDRLVLGVRWSAGDWPTQVSFPVFWTNAIRFARRGRPAGFLFERSDRNLLSERETVAPGVAEEPLDVPPPPPFRRQEEPRPVPFLVLALGFLLLSWWLSRE